MKNLIMCAFAFKEGFQTSLQTEKQAGEETTQMYLKNLFVALSSAKLYNPMDDVCLVTNCKLPVEWQERFLNQGVLVKEIPFETFVIPPKFPWALAFYKLCALHHMVENGREYEHILMMDADTYTVRSYEELWQEADFGVLLFAVGHSFNHSDREIIRRDFMKYYPAEAAKKNIVHYGGEFVAGKRDKLQKYLECCEEIYEKLKAADFQMEPHAGDETVWSIAAVLAKKEVSVTEAGAYLYRFWTGDFYLVSTVTVSNPVCIWHIPNEKETGFVRLYEYYRKNGAFPEIHTVMKIFGMRKASRPFNFYTLQNKVAGKLKKFRK